MIGTLTQVETMDLSRNRLSTLPESFGNLVNLSTLLLQGNDLKHLPASVERLHKLKVLYLSGNSLTELPEWIGLLSQLESLDVGWNNLKALPDSLLNLKKLKTLFLHGNPDLGLPPEVLGSPRIDNEVSWYRQKSKLKTFADASDILDFYFRSQRRRRLNEAKVILVGQGGVGKTSLVKRLVDDSFDAQEQKTEGIKISRWSVTAKHPGEIIRLNVWDFGGQEIMHATHQFFLTKRSIYMLVIDSRAGEREGNIHYWLEMIRIYGEGSPLVIVMNKCEQHYEKLNENRILLDYEGKINLVGFYYVSCKSGEGIAGLRDEIKSQVKDLPHVSDLLPEDYFEVKQELEAQAADTDFITEDEYVTLCRDRGVVRDKDRTRLLRFLHDLGCILHYDDPDQRYRIRDTKVLNPEWVTGGIYRVLNDPQLLREANGVLARSDLRRLLHADHEGCRRYPEHRHPFLIDMMRKYELGFDFINDPGKLLIPELLSKNEPDVGWRKPEERRGDILSFQFHYPVLPRGLIPRFIVRTHHLLTSQPTYWRAGVVLEIEGCRVLIRGDIRSDRVYVEVHGASDKRRRALAIVRDYFDAIHPSYGDLQAEAKVPLPDDPQSPPVDYEYLVALEKDGVIEQRFEKTRRKYNVRELLEGIDESDFDLFLSHSSDDNALSASYEICCSIEECDAGLMKLT
jgi:internalin A